jgi:hypothetical protein
MRKITMLSMFLVVALGMTRVFAQAPKFVLLEEFTGMNCPPCASQNPGFNTTILIPNPLVVHHIAYHPSWPGVDNMYTYNKPPVDSMVGEYSVSGVPDCIMLGNQKQTGPSGYTQSDIDNEFSAGSPVKVMVTDVISSGTTHTVTVKVSTVGIVPSGLYRLRTSITEYLHFATAPGTNGEKDFPNVFRKMMPSWAGDKITMPAIGSSVNFNYTYTEDPLWNMANVKVTSYVQNISTKEVLNCGSVGDPAINYTLSAPAVTVQHGATAGVNSFNLSSLNTGTSAEQFSYTLSTNAPSDWTANFTVGSTTFTGSASVNTPANSTNSIVIHVTPGNTPFVGHYIMKVQSVTNPSYPPMICNVYVISNVSDLIVNNSGYIGDNTTTGSAANWDSVYTSGLALANRQTVASTDELVMTRAISQNAFAGVKNIYLNIGWTFPSFTDAEVAQLTSFLNGGGCLLVSGQDVAWDTWSTVSGASGSGTSNTRAFYANFLCASFVNDGTTANSQLNPVQTDSIWAWLPNAPIANFYGGTYFFPDEIKPSGIGMPIYTYNGTAKIAGVRATNKIWKTVTIGTGIEMIGTKLNRSTVIKRAHDWFYGMVATGINELGSVSTKMGQNYPNPSNTETNIPLFNIEKDLTMQIVDLSGRVLSTTLVTRGTELITLHTADLAQGIYMYRLMDRSRQLASRPMQIVR